MKSKLQIKNLYGFSFIIGAIFAFSLLAFCYNFHCWYSHGDMLLRLNIFFTFITGMIVLSWLYFPSSLLVALFVLSCHVFAPVVRYLNTDLLNINELANPVWLFIAIVFVVVTEVRKKYVLSNK